MTAIYLSGQFEDGVAPGEVRRQMEAAGHAVTSRWLDSAAAGPATSRSDSDGAAARLVRIAREDFEDIHRAPIVVVFNPPEAWVSEARPDFSGK